MAATAATAAGWGLGPQDAEPPWCSPCMIALPVTLHPAPQQQRAQWQRVVETPVKIRPRSTVYIQRNCRNFQNGDGATHPALNRQHSALFPLPSISYAAQPAVLRQSAAQVSWLCLPAVQSQRSCPAKQLRRPKGQVQFSLSHCCVKHRIPGRLRASS